MTTPADAELGQGRVVSSTRRRRLRVSDRVAVVLCTPPYRSEPKGTVEQLTGGTFPVRWDDGTRLRCRSSDPTADARALRRSVEELRLRPAPPVLRASGD